MLKTKVAILGKQINEIKANGKKEDKKYQEMKDEIKGLKNILEERNIDCNAPGSNKNDPNKILMNTALLSGISSMA
jgi:hypothetical protein